MSHSRGTGYVRQKISISYTIREKSEPKNRAGVNRLRISSHQLCSAGRDSIVRLWDLEKYYEKTGEPMYVSSLEHHTDWVNDMIITKDGGTLMSASSDTSLKIWNLGRGACTSTLKPHKDYVQCLAYSPVTNNVVSGGLDHNLFLWDINSLTQLTASKNTVTTIPLKGQKDSVYSVDINAKGTLVVSGSTEKALKIWDVRTSKKEMKLKGHTDNVRAVLLNEDGTECVSGSSDGTIRLWSIGQQRCIETFRMHDKGVWSLAMDESFRYLYSAGKDKKVFITDLSEGGQEGVLLFTEDHSILSMVLDTTDNEQSVWVSTTNSDIKKWSAVPKLQSEDDNLDCDPSPDHAPNPSDSSITDIDHPELSHDEPLITIKGAPTIVECRILNNRRQVLTKDNHNDIALWDILHACKESDLGQVDIDEEVERRKEELYVPNWFSCDIKTGMLSIKLIESDCFSAWVMGDHTNLTTVTSDLKLNYGALMLKALFEFWPETHQYKEREKRANMDFPVSEKMFTSVANEMEDLNSFGITLGLPGNVMSGIIEGSKDEAEIIKDLYRVLSAEEELLMDRLSRVLVIMKKKTLAQQISEERKKLLDEANKVNKVDTQFFSIPGHTPVIMAESSDCGATVGRFLCSEAESSHENTVINACVPPWITDIIVQNRLPNHPKFSFVINKCDENGKEISSSKSDRLSAQDILTIKKVLDYLYNKIYGEEGLKRDDGELVPCTECFEILCNNKVLSPTLDLRTVRLSVWKAGGDMVLLYRQKQLPAKEEEPEVTPISEDVQDTPPNDDRTSPSNQPADMT